MQVPAPRNMMPAPRLAASSLTRCSTSQQVSSVLFVTWPSILDIKSGSSWAALMLLQESSGAHVKVGKHHPLSGLKPAG